ncbi:hypothetical protein [Paenibacillus polymyxa]|uniref:Uncharacterized protein n=1 Tax=Paenibacillus polymyxa TaxID=1406 RepID=A0ABX2ZAC4_PAEPO|nr:hypothetical protein [Paenibacillus polymyxa]ODA08268.1 hypothetical protein A7312_27770 [Paenibacillus polymyxa]
MIKGIRDGVSNLIKWFPIIWNDRDFDQAYLYKIIHRKLENMEEFFESKHTFSVEAPQVAKEIQEAREKLGRVITDEHHCQVDINTEEFMNVNSGRFEVDRENPRYIEWMTATDKAEEKTTEDLRDSLRIIGEKSQGWWD